MTSPSKSLRLSQSRSFEADDRVMITSSNLYGLESKTTASMEDKCEALIYLENTLKMVLGSETMSCITYYPRHFNFIAVKSFLEKEGSRNGTKH